MTGYKYSIQLDRMIYWVIPQEVPRPRLLEWARALCSGVGSVYAVLFRAYALNVERELQITPEVYVLERVLNDRYDPVQRRIYLEEGVRYPLNYLFLRAEQKPLGLYTRAQSQPLHLGLRSESGLRSVSFRVRIPRDRLAAITEISAFVGKYRLATKTYSIIEI